MRQIAVLLLVALLPVTASAVDGASTELGKQAALLVDASLKEKQQIVAQLAAIDDPGVTDTLKWLMEGNLYYNKEDNALLVVEDIGGVDKYTDWQSGAEAAGLTSKMVKKITTNNSLRKQLRGLIASIQLTHKNKDTRLAAVKELLADPDEEMVARISELSAAEEDSDVKEMMQVIVDIDALRQNPAENQQAFARLSSRMEPEVRNLLGELTASEDKAVAAQAAKSLEKIESRVRMFQRAETVFFGLSLGSVLVLAAIGLAISFGVMGVINMAHGELIMLGAYTTYVLQQLLPQQIGLSLVLSIPSAFLVAAIVGILIERLVIRHLYGRPLETLLATFGISLILQQAVRTIFSPLNRSVASPSWLSGSLEINSVLSLTYNRLYIIVFCLAVFLLLYLIVNKTSLGLQVRAVSQNRAMARAMGIRADRVDMLTFGLGSGIAGIAGVALSQLTNVGPNLGQSYIIDSFMVVVFGGVGNLWGTLVSGFSLGIANKFLEPWSGAVLAKILVLLFIILFIQKRPRGLFPQKGRAVEN